MLLSLLAAAGALTGQDPAPPPEPAAEPAPAAAAQPDVERDAVAAAIALYEGKREGTLAARGAALAKVAAHDDERVTAFLLRELEAADPVFAVRVLNAIGQLPRGDDALPPLEQRLATSRSDPVRRAAAAAIGKQGTRGIDLLLGMLDDEAGPEPRVRDACAAGLAAAGDERAWRGLAPFALRGDDAQRLRVLRLFDEAPDLAVVARMRLELVREKDPVLAATAWRQLAVAGHDRAESLFEDLAERLGRDPVPPARGELVRGLAAILQPGLRDTFRELAASETTPVRQALRAAAPTLAKDPATVDWVIATMLGSDVAAERDAALVVLRAAPATAVAPLLATVRERLRRPSKAMLDLAIALHELLAKDPTWQDDVLALAKSTDHELRTVGLSLLLELGSPAGVAIAQQSLDSKHWELRSVAIRYLGRQREPSSIPLLIARADKESGRLEAELNDALFALTGVRCWRRSEWDAWWRKNRATHVLPAEQTIAAMRGGAGGGGARGGGATVAYYGIPLVSKKVAFVIDVSGSMRERVGTDRKRTRLDEAKRQLRMVVEQLPDDHAFNVIVYETGVEPTWDELRRANRENKQEALERVAALTPRGGTNIHDALEAAFQDPQVDTIYLLSDGQPSAGRVLDVQDIADAVQRWNRGRQIVVHGIAVGTESPLLKRLAAESGGAYVMAR